MNKLLIITLISLLTISFGTLVIAQDQDFTSMSNEELSKYRGNVKADWSEDQKQSFRNEWQTRVTSMSKEEKKQYLGKPVGTPGYEKYKNKEDAKMERKQMRQQNRKRDGSGSKQGKNRSKTK